MARNVNSIIKVLYIVDILITFKTIDTTLIALELGLLTNLTLKYSATKDSSS